MSGGRGGADCCGGNRFLLAGEQFAQAQAGLMQAVLDLVVAQAQRDLVSSRIAEVQSVVNYLQSFVEMYRQEGSLLERRGIAGPGREPVELPDMSPRQTDQ